MKAKQILITTIYALGAGVCFAWLGAAIMLVVIAGGN